MRAVWLGPWPPLRDVAGSAWAPEAEPGQVEAAGEAEGRWSHGWEEGFLPTLQMACASGYTQTGTQVLSPQQRWREPQGGLW